MTGALYYPPADRTTQWYGPGNATVAPTKLLWHSTETPGGWPAYSGGASAPNLTYEPWQHLWRQHFPLNGTARALRNGTGYSTNRQGVCQVEVSCYCDPVRWGTGRGVNSLDQQAYDDMGAFAAFMHAEWGVPLSTGVTYLPYPDSYGANGVRLSRAQFTAYAGHLAHMHAPDNTHGDAGVMDVPRILAAAQGDDMALTEQDVQLIWGFVTTTLDGAQVPMIDLLRLTQEAADQGSLDRQYTNLTNGQSQTAGDLIRFTHQEAFNAARPTPIDVAALAAELAPLLADQNVVVTIDDATLAAIGVAVADEQARRLVS